MRKINLLFAILIAIGLSSCATLFSGTKSKVSVSGYPESADVYCNGNYIGTSPTKVKVSKKSLKNGKTKIIVKKSDFQDAEITLGRKTKVSAIVGNIIFCWTGLIIDYATGAIYKPYPDKIKYKLEKKDSIVQK
jgi:uncharacterized protein YceK